MVPYLKILHTDPNPDPDPRPNPDPDPRKKLIISIFPTKFKFSKFCTKMVLIYRYAALYEIG